MALLWTCLPTRLHFLLKVPWLEDLVAYSLFFVYFVVCREFTFVALVFCRSSGREVVWLCLLAASLVSLDRRISPQRPFLLMQYLIAACLEQPFLLRLPFWLEVAFVVGCA